MDWTWIKQIVAKKTEANVVAVRAVTKSGYAPNYTADDAAELAIDRATGRLLVDTNAAGGGAGTEYTEGDSDSSATGGAMIAFTSANAAVAALAETDGTLIVNPTALSNSTDSIAAHQGGTWTVGLSAGTNGIGKLTSNDGVDIGDVTINNASGASAVNIQDGGNSITVDGSVSIGSALPAGTNAIGKLAANSGVDIGDVDVTSVTPGNGATNLGKAVDAVAGATDTVVGAGAVRDDSVSALTPADGDYVFLRTDNAGRLWTNKPKTATSTVSNVTGATTNTSILSADGNRIRWSVYNDATTNMYLKRGGTASTTSYSVKIAPQGYYEDDTWTGAVDAVWDTGVSGDARVTTEST